MQYFFLSTVNCKKTQKNRQTDRTKDRQKKGLTLKETDRQINDHNSKKKYYFSKVKNQKRIPHLSISQ